MQGVGSIRSPAGCVKNAFLQHDAGPLMSFLPRLEHEDDVTGQAVTYGRKQPGGTNQARCMQALTAGMHRSISRGKGYSRLFCHRKGILVTSEQYSGTAPDGGLGGP